MTGCRPDIDKFCKGLEYTGEAMGCLTDWTKPGDLTAECGALLPKKVEERKGRVKSEEEMRKADRRRRTRDRSANLAREQHPQKQQKQKGEKKAAVADDDEEEGEEERPKKTKKAKRGPRPRGKKRREL